MNRPIPKIGIPEYRVIFYHKITGDIMKYKFMSEKSAMDLYDRLDAYISKPTVYKCERIR